MHKIFKKLRTRNRFGPDSFMADEKLELRIQNRRILKFTSSEHMAASTYTSSAP